MLPEQNYNYFLGLHFFVHVIVAYYTFPEKMHEAYGSVITVLQGERVSQIFGHIHSSQFFGNLNGGPSYLKKGLLISISALEIEMEKP